MLRQVYFRCQTAATNTIQIRQKEEMILEGKSDKSDVERQARQKKEMLLYVIQKRS